MANQDRIERFSGIRAGLDYPKSQKPNPDQTLRAMLTAEQTLALRLGNTRKPWNLISYTLTTVSGTSSYTVTQPVSVYQNSGKPHFVVRATDNTDLPYLPVEFDDFSEVAFGEMPPEGSVNSALAVPERLSFYRTGQQDQTIKIVVQPTPQEVLTYTVWFFTGSVNRAYSLMSGTGPITELNDYLDLKAMLTLDPIAEWFDDEERNDSKRKRLAMGHANQLAELEPIVEKYISNIAAPKGFEMGMWND